MAGNKKAYFRVRSARLKSGLVWLTKKNNVTIDILVLPAFRKYWVFKAFCLHVDSVDWQQQLLGNALHLKRYTWPVLRQVLRLTYSKWAGETD